MPARQKLTLFLVAIMAIFLFWPESVLARVVINEFSSSSSNDWVELYSDEDIDISGWILRDSASSIVKAIPKYTLIGPSGSVPKYYVIDASNRLNIDTDKIILLKFDDSTIVDQVFYGGEGEVCAPIGNQTIGRFPDGTGNFVRFSVATDWRENNAPQDPCPTPTPTPTPSPILTTSPTPSPTTATYKINEVKDEDGNILSSVKVYVDDVYVHHYAPEVLAFCNGCQCDTYVNCGFGEHTIKLEKSNFANWSETKTISAGDTYEVNPVMNQTNSDSSPTYSPTPSPSSTTSPKPIEVIGATLLGKILGEEGTSPAGFYPWEATEESKSQEATRAPKAKFISKLFLGLGLVFLFVSGVYLWYNLTKGRIIQG